MEGNSDIIIKYLEGKCTPEEIIEYERLNREDTDFAEEVRWYQMAYQAIEQGAKERRRNELLALAAEEKPEARRINMFNQQKYWYAIAAAITLFVMVYVFIWPDSQTQGLSSQGLLAMTDPLDINDAARGEAVKDSTGLLLELDELTEKATTLNDQGACEQAQVIWEEVAEKSAIDEYRLYPTLCFLQNQNASQALTLLGQLEDIQAQKGEDAESIDDLIGWYKIIAYTQQYEKGENVKADLKAALLQYQEAGYFQHQDRVKEMLEMEELR